MSHQPKVLEIPNEIYEWAREIAQESHLSTEAVLLEGLAFMSGKYPENLSEEQLEELPDYLLWALVWRPFDVARKLRMRELTAMSKEGDLTDLEDAELKQLLDEYDDYILRRSTALLILKRRGYDIEARLGRQAR